MKKTLDWVKRVVSSFLDSNCSMHAAGLTYFSMLAIVPILCVLLFAAKNLGVDEYAEKQINIQLDAMIANIEKGQNDDLALLAAHSDEELEKKRMVAREFASTARDISGALFDRIEKFDIGTLYFSFVDRGLVHQYGGSELQCDIFGKETSSVMAEISFVSCRFSRIAHIFGACSFVARSECRKGCSNRRHGSELAYEVGVRRHYYDS